jgi:hypothetical protein
MSGNGRTPPVGTAGLGDSDLTGSAIVPVDTQPDLDRQCANVLLHAACLFDLVEAGDYGAIEAFDRLRPAFTAIACGCERQMLRRFEEFDRELRELRLRAWRWRR